MWSALLTKTRLSVKTLLFLTTLLCLALSNYSAWWKLKKAREELVPVRLRTEVIVDSIDRPLDKVLRELARDADISIEIDRFGIARAKLTPSTPVTLNLSSPVSLKSVLMLLLEPKGLAWYQHDDRLIVTCQKDAALQNSRIGQTELVKRIRSMELELGIKVPKEQRSQLRTQADFKRFRRDIEQEIFCP